VWDANQDTTDEKEAKGGDGQAEESWTPLSCTRDLTKQDFVNDDHADEAGQREGRVWREGGGWWVGY
jgi:hypothetical protein